MAGIGKVPINISLFSLSNLCFKTLLTYKKDDVVDFNDFYSYSPTTNRWTAIPTPRAYVARRSPASDVDYRTGDFYVFGGVSGTQFLLLYLYEKISVSFIIID